jgi:hypothetical protein
MALACFLPPCKLKQAQQRAGLVMGETEGDIGGLPGSDG